MTASFIFSRGLPIIKTQEGQTIDWISSDLGKITDDGFFFNGIIHFANATGNHLLPLNNTAGFL